MDNKINRRNFFKQSTLGSAGIIMGASALNSTNLFAASPVNLKNGISGLVPVSVIEDANLLVLRTAKLEGDAAFAVVSDLHHRPAAPGNKGRLASLLPVEDKKLMELLNLLRKNEGLKNRIEKISLVYGWICNNAVYQHLKPVYGENPAPEKIRDVQLYQDAKLITELSDLKVSNEVKEEYLAALFNEILPRACTRVHTLIPAEDGMDWVNRMTAWRVNNKNYMETLANIMVNPDAERYEKYVITPNFYNPSDALIDYCRKMQDAVNIKPEKINDAVDQASTESLYAQALATSVKNIKAANQFLNGNMNEGSLESRLF